ncbi:MAG: DUF4256 domain-containing protein [Dysgonomonas sp.]|nr:DUF4256 domain-containing protein [Dysgonomonas sp.]
MIIENIKRLQPEQQLELFNILKLRFYKNIIRHKDIEWADVQKRLESNIGKVWSLNEMERTGGEPDTIGYDEKTGEYLFVDCSSESPKGRRSICYDLEGLESRKEHKPKNNAVDMAASMGIHLLTEELYIRLHQLLGDIDTKSSSWLETPSHIRGLGGALFGDCRYGRAFIYYNGAQSYYAVRGFRGFLNI